MNCPKALAACPKNEFLGGGTLWLFECCSSLMVSSKGVLWLLAPGWTKLDLAAFWLDCPSPPGWTALKMVRSVFLG